MRDGAYSICARVDRLVCSIIDHKCDGYIKYVDGQPVFKDSRTRKAGGHITTLDVLINSSLDIEFDNASISPQPSGRPNEK